MHMHVCLWKFVLIAFCALLCNRLCHVLHFGEIAQKIKRVYYHYYSMDLIKYKTKYKFLMEK